MTRDELFDFREYKALLKYQQRQRVRLKPGLTWRRIAGEVGMQHTYLSRVFNSVETHLNEDHLYQITQLLGLDPVETEYTLLLRSLAGSTHKGRRAFVLQKLQEFEAQHRLKASVQRAKPIDPSDDLKFLLDPHTMLVYLALHIEKYRQNPLLLQAQFGLSQERLQELLQRLENLELIVLHPKKFQVDQIKENRIHYPASHPLSRGHQQLLRNLSSARLLNVAEAEKTAFMAGFTTTISAAEKIKERFYQFLGEVEDLSQSEKGDRVFQMNFDLFPWD